MSIIYWFTEYISSFIEVVACFIFCGTFIDRDRVSAKKRTILLLSTISAVVVTGFNSITFFSGITLALGIGVFLIFQYIVYRQLLKSLIFTIAFFAIILTVDFSVVFFISYVSGLSTAVITLEHTPARMIAVVTAKALLTLIVFAIYKLTIKNPIYPKRHMVMIFSFSVLAFVLSTFILLRNIQSDTEELTIYSALFAIAILFLVVSAFYGVIKLAEYYESRQRTSLLTLRNRMLEESMSETEETFSLWRASLHDHKHNIFYLMTLAESNNIDEIKSYLKNENDLLTQRLFFYKTGNDTVDTILNVKQNLAHEKGISFLLNAVVPMKCRVSDSHLCAILGNLIDNALNASTMLLERNQEPYIEVNIKQVKGFLVVKIVNMFDEAVQKPYSQEEQIFHGIGLKSVRRIIKDYDGKFTTTIEEDLFIAEAMIQL